MDRTLASSAAPLIAGNEPVVTSDEALMLEVRRGARSAFETIFERYRGPIWRFFCRRVADAGRAEELAQDVFVALLQNAGRYEPRAPFRAYLFGIAFNLLLAERRKRTPPVQLDEEPLAAETPDVDAGLWVRRAIACLDPDDREILMLREYEQLTYQEISGVCGMPTNTVRTRLFRARMALKAALVPNEGRPSRGTS